MLFAKLRSLVCSAVILAACMAVPDRPALGQVPLPGDGQGGWVRQFAHIDIVPSLEDLYLNTSGDRVDAGSPRPEHIQSALLEIRTSDNKQRVASVAFPPGDTSGLFSSVSGQMLMANRAWLSAPTLGSGDYLVAWIVNGTRRSNVVHVAINPLRNMKSEPRVQIVQIEPDQTGNLPEIVVYLTRAVETDPASSHFLVILSALVLDGTEYRPKGFAYSGPPDSPLKVGDTVGARLNWRSFGVEPDPAKPHKISVRVDNGPGEGPMSFPAFKKGNYQESETVPLQTGTPLANAWDKATETLKPAPEVRTVLTGNVVNSDGKMPLAGYWSDGTRSFEVILSDQTHTYLEPDLGYEGFQFRNLPSGTYSLICRPRREDGRSLSIDAVKIDASAGTPSELTLSFAETFRVSGHVTHPDGTPAAKLEIASDWVSSDGHSRYHQTATTDDHGAYSLAAPFDTAALISVIIGNHPAPALHDVKAPRTDANIQLAQ